MCKCFVQDGYLCKGFVYMNLHTGECVDSIEYARVRDEWEEAYEIAYTIGVVTIGDEWITIPEWMYHARDILKQTKG